VILYTRFGTLRSNTPHQPGSLIGLIVSLVLYLNDTRRTLLDLVRFLHVNHVANPHKIWLTIILVFKLVTIELTNLKRLKCIMIVCTKYRTDHEFMGFLVLTLQSILDGIRTLAKTELASMAVTTQQNHNCIFPSDLSFNECERTHGEIPEYESIRLGDRISSPKIHLIVDLNCNSPNVEVHHYEFGHRSEKETQLQLQHSEHSLNSIVNDFNASEFVDDCVDNVLRYVSCASGCDPCGEYVYSVPAMPKKGILKKASPTETSKFPDRSLYYYCPDEDDDDDDDGVCNNNEYPTLTRSVSFSSVDIKEFKMTLGHHPSVSSGPPVMLDITPMASQVVPLDDYEASRSQTRRRTRRQLKLSRTDRNGILDNEGFTPEQIQDACIEAKKIRQQREETLRTGALLSAFEDLLETVSSKYNISEIGRCF
jgi:hypothetical protein